MASKGWLKWRQKKAPRKDLVGVAFAISHLFVGQPERKYPIIACVNDSDVNQEQRVESVQSLNTCNSVFLWFLNTAALKSA